MSDLRPIGPPVAAQLKRLLGLPPEADDAEVRRATYERVAIAEAALGAGFAVTFREAVASGRANPAHREFWKAEYYNDPDETRELLAQTWRQAR